MQKTLPIFLLWILYNNKVFTQIWGVFVPSFYIQLYDTLKLTLNLSGEIWINVFLQMAT